MEGQTFDLKGETKQGKEDIEWLRIWCEKANDRSLPRVALIGDSITEQVFPVVQRALSGIAHVDFLTTSYSILSPTYTSMVESFIEDSNYAVICYNYGLHGYGVDADSYENAYRGMLEKMLAKAKVVISLTTQVLDMEDLDKTSDQWEHVVKERNLRAVKLSEEFHLPVNDLYSLSVQIGKNGVKEDGVHFNETGVELLGKSKAESIKKVLNA